MVEVDVHGDDAGQRADRFLRKLLPAAPLSLIHRLLRTGCVRIDGRKVAAAERLVAGTRLAIDLDERRYAALRAPEQQHAPTARTRSAAPPLRVLFEDEDVLVVDKPGGLAVHGGTGVGEDHLAARIAAIEHSGSATFRAAPAHRIDRGTSGIVAIGRTARGLRGLTAAFRDRRVDKRYLAIVHGCPKPRQATIHAPLAIEDRGARNQKASPAATGGVAAVSHYRVIDTTRRLGLVEVEIETGRTHQVRAHLASIGHPLVGDRRYGAPAAPRLPAHRIALHAARLAFPHPTAGQRIEIESGLPADLEALLRAR